MDWVADHLDVIAVVAAGVGALLVSLGSMGWKRYRRARRQRLIERSGSVEEWSRAMAMPEPDVSAPPPVRQVIAGSCAIVLLAAVLAIDDAEFLFFATMAYVGICLALERIVKRLRPHWFENEDGDDDQWTLDQQFVGGVVPREAKLGFVAALAMVAAIVGAIWLFS